MVWTGETINDRVLPISIRVGRHLASSFPGLSLPLIVVAILRGLLLVGLAESCLGE